MDPARAPSTPAAPTVGTIMTRHVVTVSMDDSLRRVREIFDSVRFHHLVVTENKRVVGVISDRDLLKHLSPFVGRISERTQDRHTLDRRVHQIMTRRLVWCGQGMPLAEAGQLMLDRNVSCLPVLDDAAACLGIVTIRDILSWSLVRCAGAADRCELGKAA